MKLALGTVQFGLHYGVANTSGRVSIEEAGAILVRASELGIDTIDTAIAYGDSEAVLGKTLKPHQNIVTKLPGMPDTVSQVWEWVEEQVNQSLDRLGVEAVYGLLLHQPTQLLGDNGPELFNALQRLKSEGRVSKIGVSIYAPEELGKLVDRFDFDLIQAPLNIIDRRLISSGWADRLKSAGIEIYARSAFLQGLLLMPRDKRPAKFDLWSDVWDEWDRWLGARGVTPMQACIRFVCGLEQVDKLVVGVDTVAQLDEIVGALGGNIEDLPDFEKLMDSRLLNPATWSQI